MNNNPGAWNGPLERTTAFRYSEERDRPDIAAWSNQRAADLVRRFIGEANLVLALEAGQSVRFVPSGLNQRLKSGSVGVLLGWFNEREAIVSFGAECVLPEGGERFAGPWQGPLSPSELRPSAPLPTPETTAKAAPGAPR